MINLHNTHNQHRNNFNLLKNQKVRGSSLHNKIIVTKSQYFGIIKVTAVPTRIKLLYK